MVPDEVLFTEDGWDAVIDKIKQHYHAFLDNHTEVTVEDNMYCPSTCLFSKLIQRLRGVDVAPQERGRHPSKFAATILSVKFCSPNNNDGCITHGLREQRLSQIHFPKRFGNLNRFLTNFRKLDCGSLNTLPKLVSGLLSFFVETMRKLDAGTGRAPETLRKLLASSRQGLVKLSRKLVSRPLNTLWKLDSRMWQNVRCVLHFRCVFTKHPFSVSCSMKK